MAGRVENQPEDTSTLEPENGSDIAGLSVVEVKTDKFNASAISLYEMPGMGVMNIFTNEGPQQMLAMFNMFRLAINDPERLHDFEVMNFLEISEAINDWMEKSDEERDKDKPTRA